MSYAFTHSALSVITGAMAPVLAPVEPMRPFDWARKHLIVPDGPRKLEHWDADLTPYIAEPLDMTSTEHPANEIVVMKSAQTGFTTMMLAAIGFTIDRDRADMMIVQPTDGALTDFNSKKLQPSLEKTEPVAEVVAKQTARAGTGSTTYEKKFAGGYALSLALASSSADLRSKSVQKMFCDEIDEYPDDLDGQGSPFDMIEARQESFLKQGNWKRTYVSTPTIKGSSHAERAWQRSDKRRWHVTCPHCKSAEFVFEFGPYFRYEREHPYRAWYVCPGNGCVIEEYDRTGMIRAGRWIATDTTPGRIPGFHFDALSSPFVPWAKIAERSVLAGQDETKLKTFWNLTLGLPYEIRGDAPDHVRLMERREEGLKRGHIPARGLMLTASADVQMRGIWVEILAHASDRQSWVVDAFYLDGSTEAVTSGDPANPNAFDQLKARVLDRTFPDAFGRERQIDALGVDSGYRTHVVYAWARLNQRIHPDTGLDLVLALDGRDGWGLPAIGTPSLKDIDLEGHRRTKGVRIWPVGTWPIKGSFYADLRKEGIRSGQPVDPDGYCHFGTWLDETYFRQITAEYLTDETFKGRARKVWKVRASDKDNHLLDCRVYNIALAEYLGLSTMTPDEWANVARRRGIVELSEPNLFRPKGQAPLVQTDEPDRLPAKAPETLTNSTQSAPKQSFLTRKPGFLKR